MITSRTPVGPTVAGCQYTQTDINAASTEARGVTHYDPCHTPAVFVKTERKTTVN